MEKKGFLSPVDYKLLIAAAAFLTPLFLRTFRALDDNTLTSWSWVFASGRASAKIFLLVAPGLVLACAVSSLRGPFFLRKIRSCSS